MGRKPCCVKEGLNRGAWSAREDDMLTNYIKIHGAGKWRDLPQRAGLKRCGKSCRLRWLNYLRPDIKRGNFSADEEELIIRLHKLLGNRWSLIAGRLPARTDNEIKNHWNTNLSKSVLWLRDQLNNKTGPREGRMKNSAVVAAAAEATVEPTKAIRTKAVRCTKAVVPAALQLERLTPKSDMSTTDHQSISSSAIIDQDNCIDFLMDLDISEFLVPDLDMGFCPDQNLESLGIKIFSSSMEEEFTNNWTDNDVF
ncbi:hypothetical protein SLEP1_g34335 [Rubroshorea leprosula]|uniref:Uncharacterized protein n=1 Tax=Rubroshorea leprosula TaxID=152421 RepID=A0AAV5KJS5_9ROSI|nr:hypothetical protein SLEP1_g34335 [Rubroshorea leprosula]